MNLSYVQKLLLAADPFSAVRTNFRVWRTKHKAKGAKTKRARLSHERHLTEEQRKDISTELTIFDDRTGLDDGGRIR